MQLTITAAATLAFLGTAFAQTANFNAIVAPTKGQNVIADGTTSTTITWEPTAEYNEETVSILLLQGASDSTLDFYTGANVASSIKSSLGSYTWTPDASIAGFATYGLKLQLDSDTSIFQYSFPFQITAGSGSNAGGSSNADEGSPDDVDSPPVVNTPTGTASTPTPTPTRGSSGGGAASANEDTDTATPTALPASGTSGSGSGSGGSGAALTTLTQATTSATATGSSATSSSTSPAQTAGASRAVAGGFAVVGAVMAMLVM